MKKTPDVSGRLEELVEELRQLRDEIRVQLHLGSMEAKERWSELEPKFNDAERLTREATEVSRRTLEDLAQRFRDFRSQLRDSGSARHP